MIRHRLLAGALALALFAGPASAAECVPLNGTCIPTAAPGGFAGLIADGQSAPFEGATAMTVGTPYPTGRSVQANCTATGNVSLTLVDASTVVFAISAAGTTLMPYAATAVNASGTTATCTYYNLK